MAIINGTNDADTLLGGAEDDQILGLGGDDVLDGGGSTNTLDGGAGSDIYIVDNDGVDIISDTGAGAGDRDQVESSVDFSLVDGTGDGNVTVSGVEDLTLTGTAIRGEGNASDNKIIGNDEDNLLDGGAGADTLEGGAGADTLDSGIDTVADQLKGGAGNDTYIVRSSNDVITGETLTGGFDTVEAYADYSLVDTANVERLELKGTSDFTGTGNGGRNTIIGNSGNNVLDGGAGADTLDGGVGSDTYRIDNLGDDVSDSGGATGVDTLESSVTVNALDLTLENLTLTGSGDIDGTGNTKANVITGNSGNNDLRGGGGSDTFNGKDGSDTYYVDGDDNPVNDTGTTGIDTLVSSVDVTSLHTSLENLTLVGNADEGTGNGGDNTINGNTSLGNTLDGGAGDDELNGGDFADTLTGGTGIDSFDGGAGNDTYYVDSSSETIAEDAVGGGTDQVFSTVSYSLTNEDNVENLTLTGTAVTGAGNNNNNIITGNSSNNLLNGGAGADTLVGGGGNDTLDGDGGLDSLEGGNGDDVYIIDSNGVGVDLDTINEIDTTGRDRVESSVTFTLTDALNVEDLTLTGAAAINGIGNSDGNVIIGNSAANTLTGGDGTDTLKGGAGNDTYTLTATDGDDVIEESATGGSLDTVNSSLNSYTLTDNVEKLILETGAVTGIGNAGNNIIVGNGAANTLDGGAALNGVTSADDLIGGGGGDTYIVDNINDSTTESSQDANRDKVKSSVNWTLDANIEDLELTGSALSGTGNDLGNYIKGNASNNRLDGGEGTDTLNGGAGNDTYVVDRNGTPPPTGAADTIIDSGGIDTVESSVNWTLQLQPDLENLTLTGTAAINGTGNGAANRITGNAQANTLDGGAGIDTLIGGAGNDTYKVDTASDILTEGANAGTDTVISTVNWTLKTNFENLTLDGTALNGTGNGVANIITGNASANNLKGLDGIDTLIGGLGNDTLVGGAGADNLTGGGGNDSFAFYLKTEGVDTITDFSSSAAGNNDTILISRAGFGGGLSLGTITASQFVIGTAAVDASDRFIYDKFGAGGAGTAGNLYFDADGTGGTAKVHFATLTGAPNFTNADIQIIA